MKRERCGPAKPGSLARDRMNPPRFNCLILIDSPPPHSVFLGKISFLIPNRRRRQCHGGSGTDGAGMRIMGREKEKKKIGVEKDARREGGNAGPFGPDPSQPPPIRPRRNENGGERLHPQKRGWASERTPKNGAGGWERRHPRQNTGCGGVLAPKPSAIPVQSHELKLFPPAF